MPLDVAAECLNIINFNIKEQHILKMVYIFHVEGKEMMASSKIARVTQTHVVFAATQNDRCSVMGNAFCLLLSGSK